MARRTNSEKTQIPPEFNQWLKSRNIRSKEVRRNPEKFNAYYQEWQSSMRGPGRRRSLFGLPKLNLNDIGNHLGKASELINTIQSLRSMISPKDQGPM